MRTRGKDCPGRWGVDERAGDPAARCVELGCAQRRAVGDRRRTRPCKDRGCLSDRECPNILSQRVVPKLAIGIVEAIRNSDWSGGVYAHGCGCYRRRRVRGRNNVPSDQSGNGSREGWIRGTIQPCRRIGGYGERCLIDNQCDRRGLSRIVDGIGRRESDRQSLRPGSQNRTRCRSIAECACQTT